MAEGSSVPAEAPWHKCGTRPPGVLTAHRLSTFTTPSEWPIAGEWLAIGWAGLAAAILAVGLRRREFLFRAEAYVVGAVAAGATAAIGIFDIARPTVLSGGSLGLRWLTILAAATALFFGEWILPRLRDRRTPSGGR